MKQVRAAYSGAAESVVMSLEFSEFAHYYAESNLSEDQQRENFAAYASILESVVQFFWYDSEAENSLGTSLDLSTLMIEHEIESGVSIQQNFNCAACPAARKKASCGP